INSLSTSEPLTEENIPELTVEGEPAFYGLYTDEQYTQKVEFPYSGSYMLYAKFANPTNMVFILSEDQLEYGVSRNDTTTGNVVIPEKYNWKNVTTIGYFSDCDSLTSITFPKTVINTGAYENIFDNSDPFWGCTSLENIFVEDGNPIFKDIDGVLFTKELEEYGGGCLLVRCPSAKTGTYTVPDGIVGIAYDAFAQCSVTSVTFPSSIIMIQYWVFDSSECIESVDLSATQIDILPEGIFSYCSSLNDVLLPDSLTGIDNGCFNFCSSLSFITIPENVTYIGGGAFAGCSGLTSITIPSAVTSIYDYAFQNCIGITSITISSSVTSIGENVFENCSSLSKVIIDSATIASSVESNESYGYLCANATEVWILNSITEINSFITNTFTNVTTMSIGSATYNKYYVEINTYSIIYGENTATFNSIGALTWNNLPEMIVEGSPALYGLYSDSEFINEIEVPYSGPLTTLYAKFGNPENDSLVFTQNETGYSVRASESGGEAGVEKTTPINKSATAFTNRKPVSEASLMASLLPSNLNIPALYYGIPVITIANSAFENHQELTSIVIPSSVTSIGSGSFRCCSGLTSITIPNSVNSVGSSAFYGCTELTSVTISTNVTNIENSTFSECSALTSFIIPNNITSIGVSAFSGCTGFTSITLPNSVTSIARNTFSGCTGLTSITIPSSVTNIGEGAFSGCIGLTSITIPSSVISIDEFAFFGCTGLIGITIPNSVTSIGNYAFQNCSNLISIIIPSSVTNIAYELFSGCTGLSSVTIPSSVTNISSYAFSGCTSLTNFTIPSNVTYIDYSVFYNCTGLNSILVSEENENYSSQNGVLFNKTMTSLICYPIGKTGVYEIPSSVTIIEEHAFNNCTNLTSITIPISVTNIVSGAFYGCTGLLSITIPSSVTIIGFYILTGCTSLTSMTLPFKSTYAYNTNSYLKYYFGGSSYSASITMPFSYTVSFSNEITAIGNYMFYNCSGLSSISIPDSVTSIGDQAFCFCTGLTNITIPSSVTTVGTNVLTGCTSLTSMTLPFKSTYENNTNSYLKYYFGGYTYSLTVTMPSSYTVNFSNEMTVIGDYMFYGCSGFENFSIPINTTSIGAYAFYGCSGFESFSIPINTTSIGAYAFYGCSGFESISIPSSVNTVGTRAFQGCSGFTSIMIPNSVTVIGIGILSGCTSLTSMTLPFSSSYTANTNSYLKYYFGGSSYSASVTMPSSYTVSFSNEITSIGNYMFYGCSGLTNFTIPSSVTNIGNEAYSGCTGLTSLTIPSNITVVGIEAFLGCTGLTNISIPNNVTSISYSAFEDCTGLVNVVFQEGLIATISSMMFQGCTGLTSITIPSSITTIASYAFYNCTGLTSITIPSCVTTMGSNVLTGCTALTSMTLPFKTSYNSDNNSYLKYYFGGSSYSASINMPSSYTVQVAEGITGLGNYAFNGCTGMISITIPSSVTSIGSSAFYGCSNLKTVIIDSSTIAGGFTSATAYGNLLNYMTTDSELYILNSIETIGAYVNTTYFEEAVVVEIEGVSYKKFVKK
ncbi:MAG: leucine-rich repeat protein, partial [Clostridia bacterium]